MSYTESFSRTIAVHYSGTVTVNYPASEHGGSTTASYSGTAYEQVDVDIHVDTAPFDASVANCNNHVNGLTASVGAMNTAQCIAIRKNADKVSKALIDGFFHTVRTDMGTQKAELEQVINARLLLLRQQATSLEAIQDTMAEDYARTTARYQKIFNDLNRELSNRIHEIDQPVFKLVEGVEKQNDRMLHTDMVQTVATISKESSVLQAQVNTASVKNHTLQAMTQAQNFLMSKALSDRAIQNTCIDGSGKDGYWVPVCYMKTESENHQVECQCLVPDYLSSRDKDMEYKLCQQLDEMDFNQETETAEEQVKSYVQSEIATHIKGSDPHSMRVKDMINKLLNQ